ncbi:MAG: hypothetical protein ACHQ1D_00085 [Nitrososphaerales archaeon]
MKHEYDQKEISKGYLALIILFIAIFLVPVLAYEIGNITLAKYLLIFSAIYFLCFLIWKIFYLNLDRGTWMWWCDRCNKEVSPREVNEEEIHDTCGFEATYKLKK